MGLAVAPPWVSLALPHVVVGLFVFAYGACVGSFLNVLIYRLPEGISVISPPSRCPVCGGLLGWGENLPIIGWLWLRGRCRRCAAPISSQYIAIEAITGLLFVALYLAYFATSPHMPWWGQVGGPWWYAAGALRGLPAFTLHAFLLAALLAMTLIDARTFTIPIQIPVALTIVAFLLWPLQGFLVMTPRTMTGLPIPVVDWRWFAVALGGMAGVGVAVALLRWGVIRPSFADYDDFVKEGETLGNYPHARREMAVEAMFLLPVVIGVVVGWLIGGMLPVGHPPLPLAFLGGSMLGYLVGAGIVWAVRMLGTLGFGREAMGLGDVHLLAAVGSVLGWRDPLWVFFLAPF
ncbi:MAG: prepilin peptidase, partial [Phycisphaerales bacterium]|nr:prepilin peptidase [Phycisphaerales bacterium]